MRLVVLSYCNPLASHVIGTIHEQHEVAAVVKVDWQPAANRASFATRLRHSPVATVQQALERRVANWQHASRTKQALSLLGADRTVLPEVPTYTIGSRELHSARSLELFASLAPDVLLLSHAPLLKPSLFELPSLATLNIHWGIAPYYCGEHTLFWPLYEREYDRVGVTVHRIDAGIDTGPILAQGFPAISPHDDEASLMARCANVAAELCNQLLDAAAIGNPLHGRRLPGTPRQFLQRDRRLKHDLNYWARTCLGNESLPLRSARNQFYLEPVVESVLTSV